MIGKVSQIEQLGELLRRAHLRQEAISSNIANVNTPNYKTIDVEFSKVLMSTMSNQAGNSTPNIIEVGGLLERQDGNNVDMDRELAKLTKNSLQFQTLNQVVASKLGLYRSAITGRS